MKTLLKIFFIFFIFLIFIKPCEVFAHNTYDISKISINYIKETNSNVAETEKQEHYYAILQNHNNSKITSNNKNSCFNTAFGNEYLITNNVLKYSIFDVN